MKTTILLLLVALGPAASGQQPPALSFDAATQTVQVTGLSPTVLGANSSAQAALVRCAPSNLSEVLRVFFDASTTPMLGDYEVAKATLRFRPRFPLIPGRVHHATLRIDGNLVRTLDFRVEPPALPPAPQVVAVYPAQDAVPANLLRLYVVFSTPMDPRNTLESIKLLNDHGTPVEHPFLDIDEGQGAGLWDADFRRLTLFFDPGRIKRGLALNETLGPPLQTGRSFTLVISKNAALDKEFRKTYRVEAADRTPLDPLKWPVSLPRPGTRDPLTVRADKAMDEPLFANRVRVESAAGVPLQGDTLVANGGREWRFVPSAPWRGGDYRIRYASGLEDLAGNRPGRRFDEAMDPGEQAPTGGLSVSVPFFLF